MIVTSIFLALMIFIPVQVYAETFATKDTSSFFFSIKKIYFDVTEIITIDPTKKAELKIVHANEIDKEIQTRIDMNQEIPQEMIDVQKRKLEEANQLANMYDRSSIFETVRTALSSAFDRQEIRQIQADFSELRHESDPVKKQELASRLNDKINRPSVSITCLGKIDSLEIANSQNPYSTLQERCKILKLVPESAVPDIVG